MNFAIQQHQSLPYIYGESDCWVIFSDTTWAMTDVDPMSVFGRWNSQHTALVAVARAGVRSVKEYLDANLERIPVSQARRGDAGFTSNVETLTGPAVIVGAEAVSRDHNGWIHVPLSSLSTVYRIG